VKLLRESLPLCGKPFVEMIAVMARYNPFAEHAGMRRILESEVNQEILDAVKKLEGQVDRVKEILLSFK
jgi:ABC-type ATPase with predicted acetyltransferase domain